MTKLAWTASLAVLLAPVPGQETAPRHLLRLLLADDDLQWFRVEQEMTARVGLIGESEPQRLRLDVFWETRVERSTEAMTKVVYSLARLRGAGCDPGWGRYAYDSATGAEVPIPMRGFAGLVGIEITLTIGPQGHVHRLDLPQSLQDNPSRVEFMNMIRPLDLELPELPVAVGASWRGRNARSLAATDEFAVKSEYTLLAVIDGKARIGQRLVMTAVKDEKRRPRDRTSDPSGERAPSRRAHRTFTLDLRSGRVVGVEEQATAVTESPAQPEVRTTVTSQRTSRITVAPTDELEPLVPPEREAARERPVEVPAPVTSRPTGAGKNKKRQK